jgi:amino-acid N-acetyltransferase
MRLTPVSDEDRSVARTLLEEGKLPVDILTSEAGELWIARDGEAQAVGGFEFYGEDALLRSVVVDPAHRNSGIGSRLVGALLQEAARRGVRRTWLLTETAEAFFRKKGFIRVERAAISNARLLASAEFTHVCSKTAVCMLKRMDQEKAA